MRLLCLAGDGIGPEIMQATLAVLDAVRPLCAAEITVETAEIGFAALEASGNTIPDAVIAAAQKADGVILGPVSHNAYPPVAEGGRNPSGVLRKALGLFANIRPARTWPGLPTPTGAQFDLTIFRENLEGFYADRNMHLGPGEVMPDPDTALALRKISRAGSMDIARAAFAAARTRVTAVHKANVMRVSDGLFLECCRVVAADYPHIAYDECLVDAMAAHLVRAPAAFDVIVTTNMFGDILSDLAAELAGGLGLAGSLNAGASHAVAQAQHGSAPDIAGQGVANPSSLILSLAMLLRHKGEARAAAAIDAALAATLPTHRTADLGGSASTSAFATALIAALET